MDPTDYQSRCLRVQILRGLGRNEESIAEAVARLDGHEAEVWVAGRSEKQPEAKSLV